MSISILTNGVSKYTTLAREFVLLTEPSRVITDPSICFALGTDASLYRLTPKIIVKVNALDELISVMKLCADSLTHYTFRAAGTSLSGQAISDSVLIMLTENWRNYAILDKGNKIRLQPGIIGAEANRYLAPYHKKIGPDPASIESCKIGGIAANNSSGMCCGTTENSYQTLSSMTLVLVDGCVLNTGDIISVEKFRKSHSDLLTQLSALADATLKNQTLTDLIRHKYRLKNTMGFSINALIDFDDPIDILQHLMIGSEGCLGFIADITYNTIVESQFKATAFYIYAEIETSCNAVEAIASLNVAAVELIDGRAMRSTVGLQGVPEFINNLDDEATALLLECHASSAEELAELILKVSKKLSQYNPIEAIDFTSEAKLCAELWSIRKGLMPAAAAIRKAGTSVIIEDITFPVENLAAGTRELQSLFDKFDYDDAIIFGHALVGNLHFVITHDFSLKEEVQRYTLFMEDLAELVAIKYKGSLKAEHGTGRNMAPFVEREWGSAAYQVMQQIKTLFDPKGIMNPGVVINPDKFAHVTHLKEIPVTGTLVDGCMECGFCEVVCPSRNLSLSPRQRIVMFRQLQKLRSQKQTREIKKQVKQLSKQFNYLGVETCAATGLCADRCPVGINTGDLIRQLRQDNKAFKYRIAKWTAAHFALVTYMVKIVFKINHLLNKLIPAKLINSIGHSLNHLSKNRIPLWIAEYPTANKTVISPSKAAEKKVVYLPSCASRSMGTQPAASDQRSLSDVTIKLLEKAGYQVILPDELSGLCCGMPYNSQGMDDLAKQMSLQLEEQLWQASQCGKLPILIDTSPCKKYSTDNFTRKMNIFEPCEFAEKFLMDHLDIQPIDESVMLHITCSSRRMNLAEPMTNLVKRCAKKVIVAERIQCCGWAGNKGFTTPELNKSALSLLKQQIPEDCHRGISNSLTCEIGLSHHGGIPFQSILYLIDEASTAKTEH